MATLITFALVDEQRIRSDMKCLAQWSVQHSFEYQNPARTLTLIRNLSGALALYLVVYKRNTPFLAPWKKNLTINTCNPAIATIKPLSTTLKLNILASVLFTVLKFLFSLVLKYF